MKKLFPLLFIFIAFGCNYGEMEELTEKNGALSRKIDSLSKVLSARSDDSLIVYIDSLMKIDPVLPTIFNPNKYDSTTARSFSELAAQTKGAVTLLASSKLLTTEISRILDHYAEDDGDILFLIDKTGSMADDIDNIKRGLKQVIDKLKSRKNIRLAIALYGDKNWDGSDWFSYEEFGTDYDRAAAFLRNIQVTGGEDYPESVYDGYFAVQEKNFWRSSKKRMVILIGDAPSLEKPLADHTLQDVIRSAAENDIKMNFYPIIVSPVEGYIIEDKKSYQRTDLVNLVYPNPSRGQVKVTFTGEPVKLEIYTSDGKSIRSENITERELDLDLSENGNGLYILRAYDKDNNYDDARIIIAK